jgi:peptidoglycan hydrolase-like protein with peptidoglycan-binding domain
VSRPYQGHTLYENQPDDAADLVRALQADLRALGYLAGGIDGQFGSLTAAAVRAVSRDLLFNTGTSSQGDGRAPVSVASYNRGRVAAKTSTVDPGLADCLDDMIEDEAFPKLPRSSNPTADNERALNEILGQASQVAPSPYIAAMVVQESSGQHFRTSDSFITVGLDRNNADRDHITSRGYGIGQATLFHHPPRAEEVQGLMVDPRGNVSQAYAEFRDKFDRWVVGPADTADDRTVEHPHLRLRLCRYQPGDPKYMRDCQRCAAATSRVTIIPGTPAYQGASFGYQADQYYPGASYSDVPNRADFLCDWPYAARRYNGSGNDSFHYQTIILKNLLKQPPVTWS